MEDGSPQLTALWVDLDGGMPVINTLDGRLKLRNIRRDSRVALGVAAADNAYESVAIRGRVTEITTDGAAEHLDSLAQRYLGEERYPFGAPGDVRVICRIQPDHVHYFNPGSEPGAG